MHSEADNKIINLVQLGNLNELKKFLTKDTDIEIKNEALIVASEKGYLNIVEFLVEYKADVTDQDNLALIEASKNGHLNVVKFLVKHKADVTARNNQALIIASRKGHLNVVEFLVKHKADVSARNNLALLYATSNGHLDIVKFLVDNGADIKTRNNQALIQASKYGHLYIVEFLIAKGAVVTAQDNEALMRASVYNHLDVLAFLVEKGAVVTAQHNQALIAASRQGNLDIVKFLVEHKADVSDQDNKALIKASKDGHLDVVKFLVDNGVDVTYRDNETLIEASENDHLDVVAFLVNAGATDILIPEALDHRATEEVIEDFHGFIPTCDGNKITGVEVIDPISKKPIKTPLLISVRTIDSSIKESVSTCFDAQQLWNHWRQEKHDTEFASNPLNGGYFTERSLIYVRQLLNRVGNNTDNNDTFKIIKNHDLYTQVMTSSYKQLKEALEKDLHPKLKDKEITFAIINEYKLAVLNMYRKFGLL